MRVESDFFEFPKRGRSSVKKKATVLSTIPFISDSLVLIQLDSLQILSERLQLLERLQRGDRGGARGGARGGVRGGKKVGVRGGKKAVVKEVVEEEEEEVVKYSRSGRPIRPKKR